MDIHRLLSDELTYELCIRGSPTDGTVQEKRQRLRGLIRLEKLGTVVYKELCMTDDLTVAQGEVDTCSKKLLELEAAIQSFDRQNAGSEQRRIQSRLLHVIGRLGRLPDGSGEKSELLSRGSQLLGSLEELIAPQPPQDNQNRCQNLRPASDQLLDEPNAGMSQHILDEPNPLLPQVVHSHSQSRGSVRDDRCQEYTDGDLLGLVDPCEAAGSHGVVGGVETAPPGTGASHRPLHNSRVREPDLTSDVFRPMRRSSHVDQPNFALPHRLDPARCFKIVSGWNLKFDGNCSVTNFIERVEELRVACCVSKPDLLGTSVVLFSGHALTWFRSVRSSISDWDHLVFLLRTTYLSPEYDEEIWNDLRNRSQGPEEKAAIFIAVMENLFRKLSERPPESKRLTIIRRNLLPYLQNQLALQRITAISELIQACQTVEAVRLRSERVRPPPSNPRLVAEPHLMYRPLRSSTSAAIETALQSVRGHSTEATISASPVVQSPNPSPEIRCFNCRNLGHVARNCGQPHRRRCYRCGESNVTIRNCPRCSGNGIAVLEPTDS